MGEGSGLIHDLASGEAHHQGRLSPFGRHFLEMLGAMVVGMIAAGAIFVSVVGVKSWDEVTIPYPTQALLAMAVGMTLPMVLWMRHRGMSWRNSAEMAPLMVLPVIPFLCLVWFGITQSAWCGPYCVSTIVAMYALMRYRRAEYGHH
jgi:flagellar biosynthetic protein FliP